MTTNSAVSSATSTAASAATSAQKTTDAQAALNGTYNDFLNLLTTQLKNQDPLNPMDSTQFTQQLVAMSGVEQQINTNTKLDNLTALQLNTAQNAALGYIGMNVTYTSSDMSYDGTSTANNIHYTLASDATTLKVNIYDSNGNLVRSMDGGTSSSSAQQVSWDGKDENGNQMPAGTYSVQIAAADASGTAITSTTAVEGNVHGVESQNNSIYLLVGDRAVPMTSVIQAVQPANTSTTTNTTTG